MAQAERVSRYAPDRTEQHKAGSTRDIRAAFFTGGGIIFVYAFHVAVQRNSLVFFSARVLRTA